MWQVAAAGYGLVLFMAVVTWLWENLGQILGTLP